MNKAFSGGGTYFKLSKKNNEEMYKLEYCHQTVPNYIPDVEKYMKKYDTLRVEDNRFKEYFYGKISEIYLNINQYIENILNIIDNTNWTNIIKTAYTSMNLDDINWDFYIENGTKKEVYKQGYSVYPKEIGTILTIFKNMKDDYIGKLELNKKDLECILSHKNSNLSFTKYMAKRKKLGYTEEDVKEQKEKYKNYEKKLNEIYKNEKANKK